MGLLGFLNKGQGRRKDLAGEEEEEDQGTAPIQEREEAPDEEGEEGATKGLRAEGEEESGTPHCGCSAPHCGCSAPALQIGRWGRGVFPSM